MRYKLKKNWLRHSPAKIYFFYSLAFVMFIGIVSKIYWQDLYNSRELWIVSNELVFQKGEYYRLFTSMFIHGDLAHYASNAAFLLVFGYLLWGYFGFWVYPVLSTIGGSLVNYVTLYFYEPELRLLGASGLLYFTAGFWMGLYFFIERHLGVGNRLIRIAAVTLVVFFPTQYEPNVSYLAHFVGLIIGFLFAIPYFKKNQMWFRSREKWEAIPEDEMEGRLMDEET